MVNRSAVVVLAACIVTPSLAVAAAQSAGSATGASSFGALHWRNIGPFRGGRTLAVAGIPGDSRTFYFGAVGGGVWKTLDAGATWKPIMDRRPGAAGPRVVSIGAIAVAPSDSNVVYAGSGEADMRSDIIHGDGMYRSPDAGATWQHIGLDDSRQIGRILVDPKDANTLLVTALGHAYMSNEMRGVYRSADGGATWTRTLFSDSSTGGADLTSDPSGQTVFASLWRTRRPPWSSYPPSNGPGSGLFVSADGGKTWKPVHGNGFPDSSVRLGKIGVAVARSTPARVYAMVDADVAHGGLYRSDDGGTTWARISTDQRLWGRCWYFCHVTVDPMNADIVYVSNTAFYRSTDAGASFAQVNVRASAAASFKAIKGSPDGDDYHQLWIDPTDPARMILATDQGATISVDAAATWTTWFNQPTGQFYVVATDTAFPYHVYASQQDSGSLRIASRSSHVGIQERDWRPIFNPPTENAAIVSDPRDPNRVFGDSTPPGLTFRENLTTSITRMTTPTTGFPGSWRSEWVMPLAIGPGPEYPLYWSQQLVFRTRNGGNSWSAVSGDLSRKEIVVPPNVDPPTANTPPYAGRRGLVYSIAPSPLNGNVVWAGTDDGLVYRTGDARHVYPKWTRVTPPGVTPWSHIDAIDASHLDANSAFVAVDRHRLDDDHPYIYITHDAGRSWRLSQAGIPADSYVHVVREDPVRRGLLFAGTEHGVYVSFDDGAAWQSLRLNMPYASIYDLNVHGNDLVIATHGRGLWILDDIAPLRELGGDTSSGAKLLRIADAVRMQPGADEAERLPLEIPVGENPPTGAYIDYRVPANATKPLRLTVLRDGVPIRSWSSADAPSPPVTDPLKTNYIPGYVAPGYPPTANPGMNRFVWDFSARAAGGPLVPPGPYTVLLALGGKTYAQTVAVRRDPRSSASDADLREQYAFVIPLLDLSDSVSTALAQAACLEQKYPNLKPVIDPIAGVPYSNPDDPVGPPPTDFSSLNYFSGQLGALSASVESGDSAPTPQERAGWRVASAGARGALAHWKAALVPHGECTPAKSGR
jgi:photosystem II stability/assembly factor-like uncharacterized protein